MKAAKNSRPIATRLVALAMLVVMVGVALTAFVVTRRVVDQQERRLLAADGQEVAIVLSSWIAGNEPSLRVLGSVASSRDDASGRVFTDAATPFLQAGVQSLGVAEHRDGTFTVLASIGDGPPAGAALAPDRAALAQRARLEGDLVTELFDDGDGPRLALSVPVGDVVAYQESPLPPGRRFPSAPDGPFGGLRGATYASPHVDASRLVLTTEEALPLTGRVASEEFMVGADRWSVVVSSRESPVGSFAEMAPWLLLAGGLVAAVLAAAVVDVLARRRSYALALVEERTAKLREAQESAEAANRSKSEFLSRMSHELRTPLNAVLGFGQLLKSDDLTPDQHDAVNHIDKGGRHLLELINEVLDITRIETGTIALSPEAVNVGELLDDAIDLVRPLAQRAGIHMAVGQAACREHYVLADRQRARQVLLNLLSNAIKYNRQRGTVAVSCELADDGRIRMSVADTGPGLTADQQERLFTPFERLGAEQSGVEGSGIGLALSLRLAEAMGGTIGVESTPGHGSRFWFEAAAVEGPVERYERLNGATPPVAVVAPVTTTSAVLYIEDNLSNLTLVERVLAQRPGVEVVAAMQGRLGLELARQHDPALVLLDLHLPDIGGDEVLERLRDDPVTASIPVVIVSADATPGQVERLLAGGAAGYLTKPIEVADLLAVVDDALARRHDGSPAAVRDNR